MQRLYMQRLYMQRLYDDNTAAALPVVIGGIRFIQYQYPVDMVGHDHKITQFHVGGVVRDFVPEYIGHDPQVRQGHFPVHHSPNRCLRFWVQMVMK
ncbi:MAG: hypothetical protein HC880_13300 [Bacteroidia bacterium]|nr:hypothetical protein [Bacteroidia bacterium]